MVRHKVVWALQILLAVVFLAHGLLFLVPPAEAAQQMNQFLPRWFQLFLGIAEVMAAVGLTLPTLTGVYEWLAGWAAGGTMIVLVSATLLHLARREWSSAVITAVLFAIAMTVARARWPQRFVA